MPSTLKLQHQKVFHFYHFYGVHDQAEPKERYERSRYIRKGTLDLNGVALFLKRLPEYGAYESSYIILVGDHGNHWEPILEQKNPFLLIKRPGEKHDEMVENSEPVLIRDIAPTILSDLKMPTEKAYSIWNLSPEQKAEREEYWKKRITVPN